MNSLDRKLVRELWRLRGQVVAIALIVACGIASFVSMSGTYDALKLTQANYYEQYRLAEVFAAVKRAPESLVAEIQAIPGIEQVQTRVVAEVTLDIPGRSEPGSGRLVSIPEQQQPMLNDLYLRQGRYIEAGKSDEVLVSEAFAEANQLQVGDRLGAILNGRWQQLQIVGVALSPEYVYEIRAGDFFPDNRRFGVLWMGRKAVGTALNMDGAFNDLTVTLTAGTDGQDVIFRLDQLLKRYGGVGAIAQKDQLSNRFVTDDINQLRGHAVILPGIFLGVGAFLLHIVMSRLIGTQRDQIAILKAFGYSNWAIGWHFLKLVLLIIAIGAVLGTGVGMWMGRGLVALYTQFYRFPLLQYVLSPAKQIEGILICGTAAIVGALGAVRYAVSLPPAEAMRPEPPALFRRTLMERLGLQRFLSPVWQIIVRNLERKWMQSALSILGIALAVALLVVGRFSQDGINYLMAVQFGIIQRDDVTLLFNEPRPARTQYEVAQLPGVLYAESFRSVPSKLRFQHHSYQLAITGLQAEAKLRHLIDTKLNPIALPLDGVLLTNKLGEILGVQAGDVLTVEVLEGARPIVTVPVAGLVDEMLGLSAYMEISALNRLMQEGRTISGAMLAIDEAQLEPLYHLLKRTPMVASVALRKASIERFQETIARSQGIMNMVQVLFACIIAFGVVYNAARIALSERSRELATLRIIGFSRSQIAVVLLGEQGVLTLVAVPIGFVMGYGLSALLVRSFNSDLYRFPLVVHPASYAFAFIVIGLAALASGLLVRRNLDHLDLIGVLKTRE